MLDNVKIAVIGLGYVGLPLALAFARHFPGTIGFDINSKKIDQIRKGIDPTGESLGEELKNTKLSVTNDIEDLRGCNFFVVGVPTPVDIDNRPDLEPLASASKLVGSVLKKGATVVYESTVYPGVTEDFCGPILAAESGLVLGEDFKVGYSPERINPGDREHTLELIVKVVSGQDAESLDLVASVYGKVVKAGIHRAPSIKVAEAAKVIENTQRDLNIALMNELSIIFDRMGIATKDVLAAAGTKWNFLKFTPGLVGGHCIGVDPYYLTTKAQQLGYHPQVILAGRRINDDMGKFIAQRTVKLMLNAGIPTRGAAVGILGLTFKENISDLRNSRVPDIYHELKEFGVTALVHDPHGDADDAMHEYGIEISALEDFKNLDVLILAVPHSEYLGNLGQILKCLKPQGILVDIKSVVDSQRVGEGQAYWSL